MTVAPRHDIIRQTASRKSLRRLPTRINTRRIRGRDVPALSHLIARHSFKMELSEATASGCEPMAGIRRVVSASLGFIDEMATLSGREQHHDLCCAPQERRSDTQCSPPTCEHGPNQWRVRFLEDPGLAIETALGTLLRRGVDQGVFRPSLDTHVTCRAMMGAIAGIAGWFRPGRHLSAERLGDDLTAMYLRGLGAS